jgi:hypothetical protein
LIQLEILGSSPKMAGEKNPHRNPEILIKDSRQDPLIILLW